MPDLTDVTSADDSDPTDLSIAGTLGPAADPTAPSEPDPVTSGSYWSNGGLVYDVYTVNTSYRTFQGQLQLPAAGPNPTAARVVRVHAPYTLKIVEWGIVTVCPLGTLPVLPDFNTQDPADVLAYLDIVPQAPTITPGGNGFIWRVTGVYHYYRTSATTVYYAGATPMSIVTAGNFVFNYPANFSTAILNTQDPGLPPIISNPAGPYSNAQT